MHIKPSRDLTLSDCAKRLGVHRNSVARWLTEGCPGEPVPGRGSKGQEWQLDPAEVALWRRDREHAEQIAKAEAVHAERVADLERQLAWLRGIGDLPIEESKRRREQAMARLAELDLAERERRLWPIEAHVSAIARAGYAIQRNVLAMPGRLAAEVASMATPAECFRAIDREARHALEAISEWFRAPDDALEREIELVAAGESQATPEFRQLMARLEAVLDDGECGVAP